MNKYLRLLFVIIFCLNLHNNIGAQVQLSTISFKVQGFRTEKKVIVRWLLEDAQQWRYATSKGFDIERSEGNSGKFIKLNKQPIKPISFDELKKFDTSSNTYKSIMLLNKRPLSENDPSYNDELIYSMYFINSSYETLAAVNSASAYIDETIENNKSYTYRIKVANVSLQQKNNTYFQPSEVSILPPTPNLNVNFGNRVATLFWIINQ